MRRYKNITKLTQGISAHGIGLTTVRPDGIIELPNHVVVNKDTFLELTEKVEEVAEKVEKVAETAPVVTPTKKSTTKPKPKSRRRK